MRTQHRLVSLLAAAAVVVSGTAFLTGHAATLPVTSAKIDTFAADQPAPTTTSTTASAAGPVLVDVIDSDSTAAGNGKPSAGEWVEFHFSAPLKPGTLLSSVSVVLTDAPGNSGGDTLTIAGVLSAPVSLGNNAYIEGKNKASATFNGATAQLTTGNTSIRITLGSCSTDCEYVKQGNAGTATFTIDPSIKGLDGRSVTGSVTKTIALF